MADNQIAVELIAKVDQLQGGMAQAVSALTSAVESMKEELKGLGNTAKESEGLLKQILSRETFMAFVEGAEGAVEAAKHVFEAIESGYESTVGKAEEFGLSNAKFAAMMGTSETEAAGLAAALRGVGSSAQEFESLALRMQLRLNTNEQAMRQLGVATRDQSGNLLSGQALINSAISAMQQYKAGTDQNAFALEVFGRRAADVYDLMRVGKEQVDHQIELYRSMGIELEGTGEDAEKMEEAMNDLKTVVEALELSIGQRLMPVAREFVTWLGQDGKEVFKDVADGVVGLVDAMISFAEVLGDIYDFGVGIKNAAALAGGSGQTGSYDANLPSGQQQHFKSSKELIGQTGDAADSASAKVSRLRESLDHLKDAIHHGLAEGEQKPFRMFDEDAVPSSLQRPTENPYVKEGGTKSFVRPTKGKRDNSDRDILEADEKIALEKIRRAQETNQHLLSMGKATDDEFLARARALENDSYDIKLETLNKEMLLPQRTAEEQLKINNQIRELEEQHQTALLKIAQDGETKRAGLAKRQIATFIQSLDSELKAYDENEEKLYAAGQISASQRYRAETDLATSIGRAELAKLDEQIATLKKGTDAYEAAIDQRKKIEDRFREEHRKAEDKLRQDTLKDVHATLEPMESAFNSSLKGMLFQGKSFADTMRGLFESLTESFVEMILKMAEQWAEKEIVNAIIAETVGGSQARAQIAADAAAAGAAAYAATVGIPVVGLAAAPAAAAEAYAATMAFQAMVPAARGGMVLDTDQMVFAHQKEMILPANLSQGIQGLIANNQTGGSGGDTVVHVHQQFNATPQRDIRQLMNEAPGAFAAAFKQMQRDGRL